MKKKVFPKTCIHPKCYIEDPNYENNPDVGDPKNLPKCLECPDVKA